MKSARAYGLPARWTRGLLSCGLAAGLVISFGGLGTAIAGAILIQAREHQVGILLQRQIDGLSQGQRACFGDYADRAQQEHESSHDI